MLTAAQPTPTTPRRRHGRALLLALCLALATVTPSYANLLANPDFAGGLEGWANRTKMPTAVVDVPAGEGPAKAVEVKVDQDGGDSYGQIVQRVKVKANTTYQLTATLKSSKAGMAFVQVKQIKNRKEGARFQTGTSTPEWKALTLEVASADSTHLDVICRYRMSAKSKWVGETCWFADITLVEIGPDGKAVESTQGQVTPKPSPANAPNVPTTTPAAPTEAAAAIEPGSDIYVTPAGAGTLDGSSWENAMAGNGDGALQAAWDATGRGATCHIGSGVYEKQSLSIHDGGIGPLAPKRLLGVDTGEGLPLLKSSWTQQEPASGQTFARATEGVSYWTLQDLRIQNYRGIVIFEGRNVGAQLLSLDVAATRVAIWLEGGASPDDLAGGSRDILIKDCRFVGFTKNAVRMLGGVHGVRLVGLYADAGGKEFATERFQMCFHVAGGSDGVKDYDISYVDCVAMNAWDDAGDKYWNGDGFAAERAAYGLSYINCRSFNHTDGGWDDKSPNPVLVGCVAFRNKRNFRFWSLEGATLVRCIGGYAYKYGGSGTAAGIFLAPKAKVRALNCTFFNNPINVDLDGDDPAQSPPTRLELVDCIIGNDATQPGTLYTLEPAGQMRNTGSLEYQPGADGEDPQLVNVANREWNGEGSDFRSARFPNKGYSELP